MKPFATVFFFKLYQIGLHYKGFQINIYTAVIVYPPLFSNFGMCHVEGGSVGIAMRFVQKVLSPTQNEEP